MSIPMTDTEVPPLDAPYRIAPGVSDSFLRDGHVLLPSLATATEVAIGPQDPTLFQVPAGFTVKDATAN